MACKTEEIIETVRNYPVLYDKSHEDYKNNKIKNEIWDIIAEMIQDKNGDAVKTKWKNLRDCYSKCLRSNNTQIEQTNKHVDKYKTWPWVEQMSFLKPYLKFASTPEESETGQKEHDVLSHSHILTSKEKRTPPNQRRPRGSEVDKVIDYLNSNRKGADFSDETDLIFLGYSKIIKKMPLRLQAKVKFDIAKIIMEAETEYAQVNDLQNIIKSEFRSLIPINRNNSAQKRVVSPPECVDATSTDDTKVIETIKKPRQFKTFPSGDNIPVSLVSLNSQEQKNVNSPTSTTSATATISLPRVSFSQPRVGLQYKIVPSKRVKIIYDKDFKKNQ